jgi:hypothetical protein
MCGFKIEKPFWGNPRVQGYRFSKVVKVISLQYLLERLPELH